MTEKRKEIVFTDEKTNDLSKCFYENGSARAHLTRRVSDK